MADSIDTLAAVSDVYAAALFTMAHQQDAAPAVRAELEELVALTQRDPALAAFLTSTSIDADRRAASLERMFRGNLSDLLLNTLLVMNRNGRVALLPHLLRRFVVRQEQAAGEVEVRVTSAVELDAAQRDAIAAAAAEVSRRRPVVEFTVDPDVIGGLVVEIGDVRYDHSVRRHLRVLRDRLFDRSSRGLSLS